MFNNYEDWRMERIGKFTASEIWKLMTKGKGEYFGAPAKTYIKAKVAEILTQEPNNGGRLNTNAMEWGNANEAEAIARFEKETGFKVEHFGGANPKFFPFTEFSGGSPDGIFVDLTAHVEVKCPFNSTEHYEHFLLESPEDLKDYAPEYYWQIQANSLFTDCKKGYFISYDPRFLIDKFQIKIIEVPIDDDISRELKERISEAEKQIKLSIELMRDSVSVELPVKQNFQT